MADDFPDVISRACHDLRTPLASAFGFARTLERLGAVEGDNARYLSVVVEATEELGRLIDCLALVARAQDGRVVLERSSVESSEVAVDAVALVPGDRLALQGAGATLEVDRARATAGLAWLAEAVEHAVPGVAPLLVDARGDGSFAIGPLSAVMADRMAEGAGDLRSLAARAIAHVHGGTLAREGDRVVLRFSAT
ncbi:MAG: two-component system, OmpR family, sensor kinase [Gaiellales bacterium]|nr:two-component system, OmpR family, sensor kinase [Gaiellales bacterium]